MHRLRFPSALVGDLSIPFALGRGSRPLRVPIAAIVLVVLLVAAALRLYGVNWDDGYGFHPDERDIYMRAGCMYDFLTEAPNYQDCIRQYPETVSTVAGIPSPAVALDADRSPLNPHWFPLGSILIYAMVFFRFIVEPFTNVTALEMSNVGRPLAALADVASVFMVYLLGRRLYGRGVGLLASALTAVAVIHIQNSHFYRPETFSVLFTLLSFWAMLRFMEYRRLGDSAMLGLFVGLAMAPKVNVLPLVLPLLLVYGYWAMDSVGGKWSRLTPPLVGKALTHAGLAGVIALAVFFITMPYALLDFVAFMGDLASQANMARHAGLWPFTNQYIGAPPFIYQIQQSSVWGLGLPLGIVAWLAIPFTAVMALRRAQTRRADVLMLAWIVPNLLLLASFEVRFLRYVFPLMPFMVILGSRMLLRLPKPLVLPPDQPKTLLPPFQGGTHRGHPRPARLAFLRLIPWGRYAPVAGAGLVVLVLATTAFYALAFEKVYAREHPAVAASRWIKENLPPGTSIVSDNHWDEFIPELYSYDVWQFPVYEPDNQSKMETLAHQLAKSDYLVFYSNRPYGSVARLPGKFPDSANYYQRLFRGELGYRLEKTFTSYPELLGVSFQDDPFGRAELPRPEPLVHRNSAAVALNLGYADDNVIGYDHPQVLLFRNTEGLAEGDLRQRLIGSVQPLGLMMSQEERDLQYSGGTWSEIIDRDSWTNRLPVLAWFLVVELVYLLALPLSFLVFRPLPDRGIILARVLGLLVASYVTWLLVSLGWIHFSLTAVLLGLLALGGASGLALAVRWREIRDFLTQRWRLLLIGEVLFLVAFLAFVAIRAANPDLWHPLRGGEKPMELAYLNAVLRSTTMPPYDPWFAGGYLNYYYWGYFPLAILIKLARILPTTAFNLAVPLLFALTVTSAYSIVYNLAEGVRRFRGKSPPTPPSQGGGIKIPPLSQGGVRGEFSVASPGYSGGARVDGPVGATDRSPPHHGEPPDEGEAPASTDDAPKQEAGRWRRILVSPVAAGLIAAVFIGVMGNLDGVVQLAQGTWKAVDGQQFPAFDFWRSSRMVPDLENIDPSLLTFWLPDKTPHPAGVGCYQEDPRAPDCSPHITEFPFFTFLFADLHAHMMVIPFSLLVIGLGLTLAVGLRTGGGVWAALAVALLALALGALWPINSWDYPSYLLLTLALLAIGVSFCPLSTFRKAALFIALGAGVASLGFFAFLPFHNSYQAFDAGLSVSKWRTPLDRYLAIHGLFIFVAVTFLIYQARGSLLAVLTGIRAAGKVGSARAMVGPLRLRRLDATAGPAVAPGSLPIAEGLQWQWLRVALAAGLVGVIFLLLAQYWTAAMLLVLLILWGLAVWRVLVSHGEERPFMLAPLALLGLAILIGFGIDFVRLSGDIGRMNTFFKFSLQAWVLFSLVGAFMLWYLLTRQAFSLGRMNWPKIAWLGLLVLLIFSSLIYTVLGTRDRLGDRFQTEPLTLDGTAYMNLAVHWEEDKPLQLRWDLEAVRWLQDEVKGSPVVLEAHGTQYRWNSRIANYTGLPTVLGWPWHQIQQRMPYDYAVRGRAAAIGEMYNTTDLRRLEELLDQYEIEYVVVGDLERAYYLPEGLRKFDDLEVKGELKGVFRNQGVKIYQRARSKE